MYTLKLTRQGKLYKILIFKSATNQGHIFAKCILNRYNIAKNEFNKKKKHL